MDFGHWLSAAAGRHPERVAVEVPGESVTYRELLLRAVRAAGALPMRGVKRGEPVALTLEPGLPFVEALHGCLLLGAPAVPIDARLAERERAAALREYEVVVERPMRGDTGVFQLPDPPERELVALVMHTSGTTGKPKPVEITFGNIRAGARGLAQAMEPRRRRALAVAAAARARRRPDGRAALDADGDDGRAAPAAVRRRGDGRAAARRRHHDRLAGPDPAATAARRRRDARAGAAARAARRRADAACAARARPRRGLPGLPELRADPGLLDGDRRRARRPRDRRARRCPASASRSAATARSSSRAAPSNALGSPADGRSRDDRRGGPPDRHRPQGRRDHQRRRERRRAAEVEAVLAEHPDVVEAAVFARPHALWGEAITALVVPRPGGEPVAGRAARPLPRAARGLQGPEVVRVRGRAAAHRPRARSAAATCASVPPRRGGS